MDLGRVEYYLDLWRDYMQTDSHRLGYKSKSTGFNTGGVHSFEDMADEADHDAAKIVDKVIDDLPPLYKNAIYVVYLGTKELAVKDVFAIDGYCLAGKHLLSSKLSNKNLY
jgi:hypothetical protein